MSCAPQTDISPAILQPWWTKCRSPLFVLSQFISTLYSPYSVKWFIIFSVFNNRRARKLKIIIFGESSFLVSFEELELGLLQYKSPGSEICVCSVPKLAILPSFEKVKFRSSNFRNLCDVQVLFQKLGFSLFPGGVNEIQLIHPPSIRILSGLERTQNKRFFWNFAENEV